MPELATVLTVRVGSERYPGKVLADVYGQPLVSHVLKRLKQLPGTVVLATTKRAEDLPLCELAKQQDVPFHRGPTNDVVGRVDEAVKAHAPDAGFVLRAMGDCPFLATELVERAVEVMARRDAEAFVWALPPDTWPVYGAREFPYSREGWDRIVAQAEGDEREHADLHFHRNRPRFKVAYHEPPDNSYFRSYRLEVDWPEDVALVKRVASSVGAGAGLKEIIKFLNGNPGVPALNRERVEKSGPLTDYEYAQRREWQKAMAGQPVVRWDGSVWEPPSDKAQPIFCKAGTCLVGLGHGKSIHLASGTVVRGEAWLSCPCGAGYWTRRS